MRISDWSSDVCSSDLAALSIQDDISAVTAADVQRLARQYLTPARQWSLAILPKGMTLAEASTLDAAPPSAVVGGRSEEHTSELQSLMRISYAVFCLKKKKKKDNTNTSNTTPLLATTYAIY